MTEIYDSLGGGLQVGGSADSQFYVTVAINFNWTTNSYATVEQKFYWDVGEARLKWYRITGRCEYLTDLPVVQDENDQPIPDPSGRTTEEATAPLTFDDPSCAGKDQKHFFIQTVLARSPWEVCNKLKEYNFIWKLTTMQEHGCPANLLEKLPEENCNTMIDVEFCGFPECAEFCVDNLVYVKIGTKVTSAEQGEFVGTGNSFIFDANPSEDSPGSGIFSINEPVTSVESAIYIYISRFDSMGNDQTDWLNSFDDSIDPVKGEIVIYNDEGEELLVFQVNGSVVEDEIEDFYRVSIKYIEGNTYPDDGDPTLISFSQEYRIIPEFVPESDLEVLVPTVRTIRPSCASYFLDKPCMDLPFQLYCYHNLAQYTGVFSKFLKRNLFSVAPAVGLQYNSNRDAWSGTMFYVGTGDGSDNFVERWKFVFEWSCLPINQAVGLIETGAAELLYGSDLFDLPSPSQIGFSDNDVQVAVWFLRLWAQRKKINLTTSEEINYNTFFYSIFHAGLICDYFQNGLLDFTHNFYFNSTGILNLPPSELLYTSVLIDRIGLFYGEEQKKLPKLDFYLKISHAKPRLPGDYLDISSLID